MTMKELYNHFNHNVYSTINWGTTDLRKLHDDIKIVSERPNTARARNTQPLRTFEYRDFRYVETINTQAGDRGNVYYIPTGELVGTDASFYDYKVFVWWFYNHR